MTQFVDYSFRVSNLLSGEILDEVELQSFNYKELLNRPGSGQATARLDQRSTTPENFSSWKNALWMFAGNEPVWGGYMGQCTPIGGTRALNIPLKGFMEYPRSRLLRGTEGMSFNTPQTLATDIKWVAVDKFRIIKDLIDHMQSFPNGDIGLNVIWDALSGSTVENTYHVYQHKMIGEAIEEFADNINGVDWRYMFDMDGNKPRCNIKLFDPPVGFATDFRLEYDRNPGNSNIRSIDPDSGDQPINGTGAIGEGDGDSMLHVYYNDVPVDMPLYEDTVSYKSVSVQSTLEGHAQKHVTQLKNPKAILTVDLDPNLEPTFQQYTVGDTLYVRVDDGWIQYNDYYRVFQRDISFTKEMDIEVKVGLQIVGG